MGHLVSVHGYSFEPEKSTRPHRSGRGRKFPRRCPPCSPSTTSSRLLSFPLMMLFIFRCCQCSTLDGCHFNSLCFHRHHTLGWHSYMYRPGNLDMSKGFINNPFVYIWVYYKWDSNESLSDGFKMFWDLNNRLFCHVYISGTVSKWIVFMTHQLRFLKELHNSYR